MKKMLEELKNLNNEDSIEVPSGFRDRVIEQINTDKKSNIFKYIIPACSVAVVTICIIVTTVHVSDNQKDLNEEKLFASNEVNETNIQPESINNSLMKMDDNGHASEESLDVADKTMTRNNDNLNEYEDEIIDMLKINKIDAQKTENGIKAKGKIEDIKESLYYFLEHIDITQDGEYVFIKVK